MMAIDTGWRDGTLALSQRGQEVLDVCRRDFVQLFVVQHGGDPRKPRVVLRTRSQIEGPAPGRRGPVGTCAPSRSSRLTSAASPRWMCGYGRAPGRVGCHWKEMICWPSDSSNV